MSTRFAAIERMAEQDPYWRGYLAGLNDTQAARPDRTGELEETVRLLQARIARTEPPHRASFIGDRLTMDEAREKARRVNGGDWDAEWTPTRDPESRRTF